MQVLVRDNNVDQALKALKKKMQREGLIPGKPKILTRTGAPGRGGPGRGGPGRNGAAPSHGPR